MKIKKVAGIDLQVRFSEISSRELELDRAQVGYLVAVSRHIYGFYADDTLVAYLGIVEGSLVTRSCKLWFMFCENFMEHRRALIKSMRKGLVKLRRKYSSIMVYASKCERRACRFVEFFKGRPVEEVNSSGNVYVGYELR